MPTTYAHYRFGKDVKQLISPDALAIIEKYPELYNIGLHGPDLLFYYNAFGKNKVNAYGCELHKQCALDFFEKAAQIIREHPEDCAYLAYTYGFLCHFALDVTCHGYVEETKVKMKISHAELEAELDRELMKEDGHNPVKHRVTGHIRPSYKYAQVIQEFFEPITTRQVYKASKDMLFYLNILVAPSIFKRGMIYGILRLSGYYKLLEGMVIHYKRNPRCKETTEALMKLFEQAKPLAADLINAFSKVCDGRQDFADIYRYNYYSVLPGGTIENKKMS